MFKYSFNLNQLVAEMESNLQQQKQITAEAKLNDQLTKLAEAANQLDAAGKIVESDYLTNFIKSLATTKKDPATVGLTIEKMLKNLKEKGTPLNVYCADDGECMMTDDPVVIEPEETLNYDYEPCSICNYDHEYDAEKAQETHQRIAEDPMHPLHDQEVFYREEYNLEPENEMDEIEPVMTMRDYK